MLELLVSPDITTRLVESAIPTPGPSDVVIKVVVAGSNPKDWKAPLWSGIEHNSGDDVAGVVHAVGAAVTEFHVGDRVAALHRIRTPHGTFAEYALAPAPATFHIPAHVSFEEAATVPLAAMTAALCLFVRLGLPEPWKKGSSNSTSAGPLLVYGAATAVGAFAIQLAKHAGIGPIVAVAGRGIPFVSSLLDLSVDTIVDYREGDEHVQSAIGDALAGKELRHTLDCVSEGSSYVNASKAMSTHGRPQIVLVLPKHIPAAQAGDKVSVMDKLVATASPPSSSSQNRPGIPDHIEESIGLVSDVFDVQADFGYAWFRLFGKGLGEGWFNAHPFEIVPGGLQGVETGLQNLKTGRNSALKYVFRIADTPNLQQS